MSITAVLVAIAVFINALHVFFNYRNRTKIYKQVEKNRLINLRRKLEEDINATKDSNSKLSLDELVKRQRH